MATREQLDKLMAVACPWCRAAIKEECTTGPPGKQRLITTLDGGCHDARWQVALGTSAPVVMDRERAVSVPLVAPAGPAEREPVTVGAAVGGVLPDRPW